MQFRERALEDNDWDCRASEVSSLGVGVDCLNVRDEEVGLVRGCDYCKEFGELCESTLESRVVWRVGGLLLNWLLLDWLRGG